MGFNFGSPSSPSYAHHHHHYDPPPSKRNSVSDCAMLRVTKPFTPLGALSLLHSTPNSKISDKPHWSDSSPPPCFDTSTASSACLSTTNSNTSVSSTAATTKSSAELVNEIMMLEVEILQMERHLLSLYRTTLDAHPPRSLHRPEGRLHEKANSPLQLISDPFCYKMESDKQRSGGTDLYWLQSDNLSPEGTLKEDPKIVDTAYYTLVDHLQGLSGDTVLKSPHKLSEDIVRCMSSIYCQLTRPSLPHSRSSFLSSKKVSSHQLPDGDCTLNCNGKVAVYDHSGSISDHGLHTTVVEVLKLSLDNDTFSFAARALQIFRSLVKKLEKVDPTQMKREEKLAFWINIHNALMMHVHMAYGTHSRVRKRSALRAAYDVGGQCITACDIRSFILGIHSHKATGWLEALLSPTKKYKTENARHVYSIEYPEPLVYFALCSGAFSDPMVRVYKAQNVFHDLRVAKDEFIRSSVYVSKDNKILLPKILSYFAEDMSLSMMGLLEQVMDCISDVQQMDIKRCMKKGRRMDRCVCWTDHCSTFRFLIVKQ